MNPATIRKEYRVLSREKRCIIAPYTRHFFSSPLFSSRGGAKRVRGVSVRDARRLTSGGVLCSPSSTASKRNEVMAHLSRASTVRR